MTGLNRRALPTGVGLGLSAAWLDTRLGVAAADVPKISLSLNENPFGPSPRALEAVSNELSKLSRYNTEERTQQLIDVIAAKERVSRQQVVLGEIQPGAGAHVHTLQTIQPVSEVIEYQAPIRFASCSPSRVKCSKSC